MDVKWVSAVSPSCDFFEFLNNRALLRHAISVYFFDGIPECNHRFDASNDKSGYLIKNEENKIVPTKSLMLNVLVGEI